MAYEVWVKDLVWETSQFVESFSDAKAAYLKCEELQDEIVEDGDESDYEAEVRETNA